MSMRPSMFAPTFKENLDEINRGCRDTRCDDEAGVGGR